MDAALSEVATFLASTPPAVALSLAVLMLCLAEELGPGRQVSVTPDKAKDSRSYVLLRDRITSFCTAPSPHLAWGVAIETAHGGADSRVEGRDRLAAATGGGAQHARDVR
jgi:hypothetical protein